MCHKHQWQQRGSAIRRLRHHPRPPNVHRNRVHGPHHHHLRMVDQRTHQELPSTARTEAVGRSQYSPLHTTHTDTEQHHPNHLDSTLLCHRLLCWRRKLCVRELPRERDAVVWRFHVLLAVYAGGGIPEDV